MATLPSAANAGGAVDLAPSGAAPAASGAVRPDCIWTDDSLVERAVRSPEEQLALRALLEMIRAVPVPLPPAKPAAAAGGAAAADAHHSGTDTDTDDGDEASTDGTTNKKSKAPLSPFSAAFDRSASTALRFLRARDGDVPKALAMWTESLSWRVSSDIAAKCRRWAMELARGRSYEARTVRSYWYGGHLGVDKRGIPVNLVRIGRGDPGGIVRECGLDVFIQQCVVPLLNATV
jgi:hypothetical protein